MMTPNTMLWASRIISWWDSRWQQSIHHTSHTCGWRVIIYDLHLKEWWRAPNISSERPFQYLLFLGPRQHAVSSLQKLWYQERRGKEGPKTLIFLDLWKQVCFNKHTISVCICCFWLFPWTSATSPPRLTVSLYICISGSNQWGELEGLWRALCQRKRPIKVPWLRLGSCW